MRISNHNKLKKILIIGSIGLIIALLDVGLVRMQYLNYLEKISIISTMVNTDHSLDKASQILKTGKAADVGDGYKILYHYGYRQQGNNAFFHEFQLQMLLIVSISFALFVLLCLIIYLINKLDTQETQKEIEFIEKLISDYKQGIVKRCKEDNPFETETMNKLYEEICSFGDAVEILNERERKEKESTKSLVSDISHQLKTPVAALKTSFEILQQGNLSPEERIEFTNRCEIQITGIENLLGALINISRMEAGMIHIKLENQCIFDTMVESINRVYEKAERKKITIEFEAEEEIKEFCIPHDNKWLCEAVINILENAIKYSYSDTVITIRMQKMVMFLRIEICDQGIGISKEEYNQIFQRFYRGHSSFVKNQTGSGIGLYLTREIISRHYGTIRVETGDCQIGSKFIIQLPLC